MKFKKAFYYLSFLLVVLVVLFSSCSTDEFPDSAPENSGLFTPEQRKALSTHFAPERITSEEAIFFANEAMTGINAVSTRSVSRRVASVEPLVVNVSSDPEENPLTRSDVIEKEDPLMYIVNYEDEAGYVVVSADPRTEQILVLCPNGNMSATEFFEPCGTGAEVFKAHLLPWYNAKIAEVELNEQRNLAEALAIIDAVAPASTRGNKPMPEIVYDNWSTDTTFGPFLNVQWGQGSPYNDLVTATWVDPEDQSETIQKAFAGCTPTALAQMMTFYKYPDTFDWDVITQHKNSYYDWYTPAYNEIAELFKTISRNENLNVEYDNETGAAGASLSNSVRTLRNLGYSNPGTNGDYNRAAVETSLISSKKPVLISGYATRKTAVDLGFITFYDYEDGHSWVIDGARIRHRRVNVFVDGVKTDSYAEFEVLMHCNFGWDEQDNGYYNSGVFDTNKGAVATRSGTPYYYQYNLEIITGIQP